MTKTVLTTGTSSGYGKAIAQRFLDRGWNVLATMRRPDPTVFAPSDRLKVIALDVTKPASVEEAIAEGIAAFGAIDVLVNNAGIGLASAVEVTPNSVVREIFETNTFGVIAMCRAIIPLMRKQGHGTIVNVTSSTGIGPMPMVAIYAASKTAVEGFTESLSYELNTFGIKARLVEPGLAPTTNFGQNAGPRMAGLIPPAYEAYAHAYFDRMTTYPTRYCSEAEVAEATFLAATEEGRRIRYPPAPTPSSWRHSATRLRKSTTCRRCGKCSTRASERAGPLRDEMLVGIGRTNEGGVRLRGAPARFGDFRRPAGMARRRLWCGYQEKAASFPNFSASR